MKKPELLKALADATGLKRAQVAMVLEAQAKLVTSQLTQNQELTVPGLGIFKTKLRPAHSGRNPNTGEAIEVPAKTVVAFKAEKAIRDAVNPHD